MVSLRAEVSVKTSSGVPDFQNPSIFEQKDLIGPGEGVIDVMGGHHYGDPLIGQLVYNLVDHGGMLGIQGRCRLIQNDDIRMHHQNIGDGNLLLLSAA